MNNLNKVVAVFELVVKQSNFDGLLKAKLLAAKGEIKSNFETFRTTSRAEGMPETEQYKYAVAMSIGKIMQGARVSKQDGRDCNHKIGTAIEKML